MRQALLQHHAGAVVEEAETCSEAMEAILSRPFDCVFFGDLGDGSGLGCLVDVRGAGVTTPVIVVTGDEGLAAEGATGRAAPA